PRARGPGRVLRALRQPHVAVCGADVFRRASGPGLQYVAAAVQRHDATWSAEGRPTTEVRAADLLLPARAHRTVHRGARSSHACARWHRRIGNGDAGGVRQAGTALDVL